MEFEQVLASRRSVRAFQTRTLTQEQMDKLLWAAGRAPSAGNLRPCRFFPVTDRDTKWELAGAANQGFVEEAPLVLVIASSLRTSASKYAQRGRTLYAIQDAAAAAENVLLMAVNLGLGACWIGAFDEDAVARILDLDPDLRPTVLIPVGYPR
jgi:nitroreductase